MFIRKARREDSNIIAPYIMLAMNEILHQFIGENSPEKALSLLETLIRKKGNQYSYENCWVAEQDNALIAAAIVYDGARLKSSVSLSAKKSDGSSTEASILKTRPGPVSFILIQLLYIPVSRARELVQSCFDF